jgi:hypothetical protein
VREGRPGSCGLLRIGVGGILHSFSPSRERPPFSGVRGWLSVQELGIRLELVQTQDWREGILPE